MWGLSLRIPRKLQRFAQGDAVNRPGMKARGIPVGHKAESTVEGVKALQAEAREAKHVRGSGRGVNAEGKIIYITKREADVAFWRLGCCCCADCGTVCSYAARERERG